MTKRRTPAAVARLLLINAKLYEAERDKDISRFRVSLATLRKVSGRRAIRDRFLSELQDELAEIGWYMMRLEAEFAVIDVEKIVTWVKLSVKRLDAPGYAQLDDESLEAAFREFFPEVSDEGPEE